MDGSGGSVRGEERVGEGWEWGECERGREGDVRGSGGSVRGEERVMDGSGGSVRGEERVMDGSEGGV